MTISHQYLATLEVIASDLGIEADLLRIDAMVEGRQAVFYEQEGKKLCACAVGSAYWHQSQAKALVSSLISRISGRN